jgi:hypothetical protein
VGDEDSEKKVHSALDLKQFSRIYSQESFNYWFEFIFLPKFRDLYFQVPQLYNMPEPYFNLSYAKKHQYWKWAKRQSKVTDFNIPFSAIRLRQKRKKVRILKRQYYNKVRGDEYSQDPFGANGF